MINASQHKIELTNIYNDLKENTSPLKSDIVKACTSIIRALAKYEDVNKEDLKNWLATKKDKYSRNWMWRRLQGL